MEGPITANMLLAAYAAGYFPMAESRDNPAIAWYHPEERGVLPLDGFHVPRSLARFLRKNPFTYTTDKAFDEVIRACAERKEDTWINHEIVNLYSQLHEMGFAHSVECWQEEKLVGGLYGVAIGGAFFGESMFSRTSNASKAALVYLVGLLKASGYALLDTQFTNEHLVQFGIVEIPRDTYLKQLEKAIRLPIRWKTAND